jgi:hypothetical protein
MRTVVFRCLAGLLAPAFAWVLLAGEHTLSARQVLFGTVVAAVFGLFALFGPGPADWLLVTFFGGPQARRNHGVPDPNVEGWQPPSQPGGERR